MVAIFLHSISISTKPNNLPTINVLLEMQRVTEPSIWEVDNVQQTNQQAGCNIILLMVTYQVSVQLISAPVSVMTGVLSSLPPGYQWSGCEPINICQQY